MSVGKKIQSFFEHHKKKQPITLDAQPLTPEQMIPTQIHIHVTGDEGTGRASFVLNYMEELPKEGAYILKADSFEVDNEAYYKHTDLKLANKDINLTFSIKKDRTNPFHGVANKAQKNCDIAIIMVDLCSRDSFENAQRWYQELQRDLKENAHVALVANKSDSAQQAVKTSEIQELAQLLDCEFYLASALRENVSNIVHQMVLNAVNHKIATITLASASDKPTFSISDISKTQPSFAKPKK